MSSHSDIIGHTRWAVAAIGFAIIFMDGFDTALLPLLLPTLAPSWAVEAKSFALPLTVTNIGAVIGFLASGWLASRIGLKRTLLIGCVWFGLWSLATAFMLDLRSIPMLTILRLLTGFGLGIVVPTAIGSATKHAMRAHHAAISVLVTLGLGAGAAACGFLSRTLLQHFGAAGTFMLGGILPLVIAIFAIFIIPQEAPGAIDETEKRARASVGLLFQPELRRTTILLWIFSFSIFIAYYTLSNWIPSLLVGLGFAPAEAPLGIGFFSIGAVLGGIVLFGLVQRFDVRPILVLMTVLSAVAISMVVGIDTDARILLLLLLGGAGFGIVAGQIGQLTLAVLYYPPVSRTTGVGWAAAMGRLGSIVGPALGGMLLQAGLDAKSIVLTMLVPIFIACAIAAILWQTESGNSRVRAHIDQV